MRLAEDIKDVGLIEQSPLLEGRNMTMLLAPTKAAGDTKPNAKAEDTQRSEEAVQDHGDGQAAAPEGDAEPQPREEVRQA
jgi:translation initiation factor IF-3